MLEFQDLGFKTSINSLNDKENGPELLGSHLKSHSCYFHCFLKVLDHCFILRIFQDAVDFARVVFHSSNCLKVLFSPWCFQESHITLPIFQPLVSRKSSKSCYFPRRSSGNHSLPWRSSKSHLAQGSQNLFTSYLIDHGYILGKTSFLAFFYQQNTNTPF